MHLPLVFAHHPSFVILGRVWVPIFATRWRIFNVILPLIIIKRIGFSTQSGSSF
jgi:hypothetical protein